jgi:hypothetical protein
LEGEGRISLRDVIGCFNFLLCRVYSVLRAGSGIAEFAVRFEQQQQQQEQSNAFGPAIKNSKR